MKARYRYKTNRGWLPEGSCIEVDGVEAYVCTFYNDDKIAINIPQDDGWPFPILQYRKRSELSEVSIFDRSDIEEAVF